MTTVAFNNIVNKMQPTLKIRLAKAQHEIELPSVTNVSLRIVWRSIFILVYSHISPILLYCFYNSNKNKYKVYQAVLASFVWIISKEKMQTNRANMTIFLFPKTDDFEISLADHERLRENRQLSCLWVGCTKKHVEMMPRLFAELSRNREVLVVVEDLSMVLIHS